MGYVIVKHFDISEDMKDYEVLKTERLKVESGEHIFNPVEFDGFRNVPFPEPPIVNPDICNQEWEPPELEPIPFGSPIEHGQGFDYIEFYYEKVIE